MKFLIDESLPRRLARSLNDLGHMAWHSVDLLGEATDDRAIWRAAIERGAAIVSKDSDFIPFVSGAPPHTAVIWLRIGNFSARDAVDFLFARLELVLAVLADERLLIELR